MITKVNSSAYHPQTNGLTERFNKTLSQMLASYVQTNQQDWPEWVDTCLFAYNTSKHASSGQSPFELLYGRSPRLPADIAAFSPVLMFTKDLKRRWLLAKALIEERGDMDGKRHDIKYQKLAVVPGDQVRLRQELTKQGLKGKLRKDTFGELQTVKEVDEKGNALVDDRRKEKWVHKSRLKIKQKERKQYVTRTRRRTTVPGIYGR
jgi:hypothetical protein